MSAMWPATTTITRKEHAMSLGTYFRRLRRPTRRRPSPNTSTVRLHLEALEDRRVPALFITDMTQLAQQFPRHSGPTTLWLNFDGYTDQGVNSYVSVSGNRSQDIHDILFKTQEIFAPFDVIVRR